MKKIKDLSKNRKHLKLNSFLFVSNRDYQKFETF